MGGLRRVDQDVLVRADGVAAPRHRAVLHVVGGDVALDTELAAGDADQHLVARHQRSRGAGLALAGVAVLHRPLDRAGLRVERDQRGVGLVQEDHAVAVGDAAVDGVAAHHRNDVRILPRLVLPDDAAVVVEVEGEDLVGERRVNIHHVADHQRAAFVAAQDAGRECPGDLQVADIAFVDLIELAVAGAGVVAERHHPVLRVLLHLQQPVVGERSRCRGQQDRSRGHQESKPLHFPSPDVCCWHAFAQESCPRFSKPKPSPRAGR